MTGPVPADAWVPVPMRWRNVRAGDVVLDPDGRPWMVVDAIASTMGRGPWVHVQRGDQFHGKERDPDATVPVLVALAERDAVERVREQLGPVRLVDRRA